MQKHSFWSGLVVSGFAILALTWIIPNYAGQAALAAMPPDLLPRIAAWTMLISGLGVVVTSAMHMYRSGERLVSLDIDWAQIGWSVWPFIYVAACVYVLSRVQIIYFGPVMIGLLMVLLGERRWYVVLPYSVIPVAMVYFLAVYMMRVGVI